MFKNNMQHFIRIILLVYMILNGVQTDSLIRETTTGLVRGALKYSRVNTSVAYYGFTKIPYAHPPTGHLRFQEPLDPISWSGIRDATIQPDSCVQIKNHIPKTTAEVHGSEDCLYLNVYEPITARKNNTGFLPVMVWIHGGTFAFGKIENTGPDYLMEKPVVIIEIQYRLNVFGFLSTLDENAKGNVGLKDQLAALKWVQRNVHNFGGDRDRVTIFGASAGGASVLYHMLSPKSKGYFHRAISESGSPLNRWAYQSNPKEMVLRLAKGLGIETSNTQDLVRELQRVNYKTLIKAVYNTSITGYYFPYYAHPFAPTIEKESETAFLTESMFNLLSEGKIARVPYIAGYNTEEGSFGYGYIKSGAVDINIYQKYPDLFVPISMNIEINSTCQKKSLKEIEEFYFKNGNLTDSHNWISYMSQELFVRGIVKTVNLIYKYIPVYVYRFSYLGKNKSTYLGGVQHYQETEYLWYIEGKGAESDADEMAIKRFVTLWTNFAATGNPTPKEDELLQNIIWPPLYPNKAYLQFGKNLWLSKEPNLKDSIFWDRLFDQCGNPDYITY